jgi:spore coat protein JB
MMRRLQQLDFAIQELILYLDVYPECSRALEQFHRLRCEREQLMQEYREQCAPVCATDNVSGEHWDWISAPWPWQNDFVGNDKGQL